MENGISAKIPIILDTDIGSDIDDTWALIMLLKSPELDIKLITTVSGDTEKRARIVAKLLTIAERTDIPIGLGPKADSKSFNQDAWGRDFPLEMYQGKIYWDGVQAIIDCVHQSSEKITIIAIGPLTNIALVLKQDESITEKSIFIGMQGSVYKGYNDSPSPQSEYNVRKDIKAARIVFETLWNKLITPLDTCGLVKLKGEKYQKIAQSDDILLNTLIENYSIWSNPRMDKKEFLESSILYDTVAIYLAYSQKLVNIERLPLYVDRKGKTSIRKKDYIENMMVSCAISWKDLNEFEDHIVSRLLSPTIKVDKIE